MCAVICAMLAVASRVPGEASGENPCLAAEAATQKQLQQLEVTKRQRFALADAANLRPWIEEVKAHLKQTRRDVVEALDLCRSDVQLGPRTRRAAITRLRKRLRAVEETDRQMQVMKAFETDPRPQIDTPVLERVRPPQ